MLTGAEKEQIAALIDVYQGDNIGPSVRINGPDMCDLLRPEKFTCFLWLHEPFFTMDAPAQIRSHSGHHRSSTIRLGQLAKEMPLAVTSPGNIQSFVSSPRRRLAPWNSQRNVLRTDPSAVLRITALVDSGRLIFFSSILMFTSAMVHLHLTARPRAFTLDRAARRPYLRARRW